MDSSSQTPVTELAWAHVTGQGPPAVLAHGIYPGGPESFAAQQPLSDTFQLIAVDRRGYGANPAGGKEVLGWPADATDLEGLLERLGGAHLVGHSYGGVVVALVAGRRPELVHSMVLVDPSLHTVAPQQPEVAELVAQERQLWEVATSQVSTREWATTWMVRVLGVEAAGAEALLDRWGQEDWTMLETVRAEQPASMAPVDYERLAQADFPKVLVVGGAQVPTAPSSQHTTGLGQALVRGFTERCGGTVEVFANSTHFALAEEPDRFNTLLRAVWTRPQATAGPAAGAGSQD